ncbi:MAG: aspartyl protease family protein [Anaerohalosphaeraceae bacterium]|nr:aspartyl protease family protein [Anaerohalosphaeraceae bacterium]
MLWIRISNPDHPEISPVKFMALVDTGADDCVFPASAAQALGHNLTTVKPKVIHGVNTPALAYPHTSTIEILEIDSVGLPTTKVLYTIKNTPIDYLVGCQNFILGTRNFLTNFVLKIDYPNQKFSIRRPSPATP